MEYFTEELWDKINGDSLEEEERASIQWKENLNIYKKRFQKLESRLSKKTYNFFNNNSLHDYYLVKIEVLRDSFGRLKSTEVVLWVTNKKDTLSIKYKGVKEIFVNYLNDNMKDISHVGADSWGYDELLDFNEETISHEILFSSGARILVRFKNKGISISKIKKYL